MTFTEVLVQIIGFMAMGASALTFQMRTHKSIMRMQVLTAFLFALHYLLLGGMTAFALNAAAIVRNVIFLYRDKKPFDSPWWTVFFCFVMVGVALLSWDGWYSLLFAAAMVFNTLSFSMKNPQSVRKIILLSAPLALAYDAFTGSLGGAVNEIMASVSAVVGLIRYKGGKKEKIEA